MRHLVFCYGTLLDRRLMAAIIGRRAQPRPASLSDYQHTRLPGRPYPGLWPRAGARTDGVLYALHHRRELRRLDDYEGGEYRRCPVMVDGPQGMVRAWVYVCRLSPPRGPDRPWSPTRFQQRQLRRYLRQAASARQAEIAGDDAPTA